MKKTNKKGFTLAELLIVIAIIAVLIAIAIPTFSGALRNARLQTDHANIRSAYAMVMTANMMGYLDYNGNPVDPTAAGAITTYYFQKDGTLGTAAGYELQVDVEDGDPDKECSASIGCGKTTNGHKKGNKIQIAYEVPAGSTSTEKEWVLKLVS